MMDCIFTLAPMSDQYIDIILGAIDKVDTSKIHSKTSRMGTIYQGKPDDVFCALHEFLIHAYQKDVHMTMNLSFSKGEELSSFEIEEDCGIMLDGLIAIYPSHEDLFLMNQEIITHSEHMGIYQEMILNKVHIRGNDKQCFELLRLLHNLCVSRFEKYVMDVSLSMNSPTAE